MDEIIAGIKEKVLALYPTILADLGITDDQLEAIVENVVDRALVYMNRDQLVHRFEKDLVDYPQNQSVNDDFWACYKYYPIPPRLYNTLAKVSFETAKTMGAQAEDDSKEIKSLSDGQQSVSYGTEMVNFFASSDDSKVFSGSLDLLKRYILPTIVSNEDTGIL